MGPSRPSKKWSKIGSFWPILGHFWLKNVKKTCSKKNWKFFLKRVFFSEKCIFCIFGVFWKNGHFRQKGRFFHFWRFWKKSHFWQKRQIWAKFVRTLKNQQESYLKNTLENDFFGTVKNGQKRQKCSFLPVFAIFPIFPILAKIAFFAIFFIFGIFKHSEKNP